MTSKQKIEVQILAARPKLKALLDVAIEERTDDQKSEIVSLSETLQNLDADLRAAILAAPDKPETLDAEKPEARERRELRGKAKLSGFISAVLEDRRIDGAELECSQAFGCSGKVPLEMFERRGVEERVLTPSPSTSDQVIARPITPAIFQRSAAAWLGIDMPAVANGDAGFVTLGTSVTAGPKPKSGAADETAAAFAVTTAQPRRNYRALPFHTRRQRTARRHGRGATNEPQFCAFGCARRFKRSTARERATARSTDC